MIDSIKHLFNYPIAAGAVLLSTLFFTGMLISKIYIFLNRHILEAMGNKQRKSIVKVGEKYIGRVVDVCERGDKDIWFYKYAKITTRQAGFYSRYAPVFYIILQFIMPIVMTLLLSLMIYPEIPSALLLGITLALSVFTLIKAKKMEVERDFKRSAYKVYRYMHNQLAAGVSIHDTIKSLYLAGRDTKISRPLLELSARYSRTLDIEESLAEFKQNFSLTEVQTLCTALEQGVKTGESSKILHRQEKTMFKQYFNYIQAETEKSKTMTMVIAGILAAIIVLMIMIPMLGDVGRAFQEIFVTQ